MKLIKNNLYHHFKKIYVIKITYYFLLKYYYFFLSVLLLFLKVDFGIIFTRKALGYGAPPIFLKKKILFFIRNINNSFESIFLLVAILNALGYVYTSRRILLNHSKDFRYCKNRIFKSELFSAFGHIALLDFFVKAKLLGYQIYENDYIESNVSDFVLKIAGNFFDFIDDSSNVGNSFSENFNYTIINNNFKLFDDFVSMVQMDYERSFSPILEYSFNNEGVDKLLSNFNWYVCIHTRDSNDHLTDLRNSPINDYHLSMKNIILKGGGVYRIKDGGAIYSISLVKGKIHEILIYKDLEIQLKIISGCRFFIGSGSGPINIASHVLGRPVLSTNWAPLGCRLAWRNQVILPKQYIKTDLTNVMLYSNRLRGCFSRIESSVRLKELGYRSINNSKYEIDAAVSEMLKATERGVFNAELFLKSDLQKKFYMIITNDNKLMPIYISGYYSNMHHNEIN